MASVDEVRSEMGRFWGEGPGSDAELSALADALRTLEKSQVELLGAMIPHGIPGTPMGTRLGRLHTLVAGILKEK